MAAAHLMFTAPYNSVLFVLAQKMLGGHLISQNPCPGRPGAERGMQRAGSAHVNEDHGSKPREGSVQVELDEKQRVKLEFAVIAGCREWFLFGTRARYDGGALRDAYHCTRTAVDSSIFDVLWF